MSTALAPALQNGKQSAAFAAAFGAAPQESLSEGIGSGYAVIGYKGKTWDLRTRGQRYIFTRPDDGSPANSIDVIILRQAKVKSKSFYPKYDPNQSEGVRPICSSLDGVKPDADVQQRQAEACAICPKNVWYTNSEGRKTRDCTDYKRLAVLILPEQTKRMLGQQLMEPAFLRIPPASLNDLGTYGDNLNAQGYHYSAVVTRISFDPNQPHPKMVFQAVQALTDAEAPVVLPLRENIDALRITGEDKVSGIAGAAALPPAATSAPALAAPVTQPAATAVKNDPPPAAAPLTTGLVAAPTAAVAPLAQPGLTGNVVIPPQEAPKVLMAVADDVGEADAALNARIASLLGKA